ncbi:MAG: hypothetical protein ACI9OU_001207 [Candidatus Promineifilaceae bacterium]|jgi:hypothetical protein
MRAACRHFIFAILLGMTCTGVWAQTPPPTPWVEAKMSLSHQKLYVHSRFTLTMTISSRNVRLSRNFNLNGLPPEDVFKLSAFSELPLQRHNKNGVVTEVRQFRCQGEALRPGSMKVSPQLRYGVLTRQRGFRGSMWSESGRTVAVRPINVTIQALPAAGKPPNFSGAIGQFDFSMQVSPTDVQVEELVEVTLKLKGKGHLESDFWPELTLGRSFKVYPPKASGDIETELGLTQTIIPQTTNATHIPSLSFAYFDPVKGRYIVDKEGPFLLTFHSAKVRTNATRYVSNSGIRTPHKASPSPTGLTEGHSIANGGVATTRNLLRNLGAVMSGIAALSLLIAVLYVILGFRTRKNDMGLSRRHLRTARAMATAAIAVLLSGVFLYRHASTEVPHGTANQNVSAYLGPSTQGLLLFEIPASATVEIHENAGRWTRVDYRGDSAWVRSDALNAVDPTNN